MRVELRVLVVLGLAVAAWLLLTPTPSLDGSGCGAPLLGTADEVPVGRAEDCPGRNQTRVTQAAWTLAGVGLVALTDYLVRNRPPDPPESPPGGHWD